MSDIAARPHVVVVGGGVTGAGVALHLAEHDGLDGIVITVVEPRSTLGSGLAYSTIEPSHRVNVPAKRMSMRPDDPEHFARWLATSGEAARDPDSVWRNGDVYPRRNVFGRYVEEQLAPHIQHGRIAHEQDRAIRVGANEVGWTVGLSNGRSIVASAVVLAATHPPPGIPAALREIVGEVGFVANPYDPEAFESVPSDAAVLIVGTGLTSADTVAELDRRGHRGTIVALSRHGLRSRGHPDRRLDPFGDFAVNPSGTAMGLLRSVRRVVTEAETRGLGWHPVFDRLRAQGPEIWAALPVHERARLVKRLRSFWDVHRFRIAPQVEAVLDRRASEQTLTIVAANLIDARRHGRGFAVRYRRRGQRQSETIDIDLIVNATGPAHGTVMTDNPALRSLAQDGHIRADPYGLGIDTSPNSRAISVAGAEGPTVFVAGPLARGTFGELMGLPEVARHAQTVAIEVGSALAALAPRPRSVAGQA